MAGLRWPPEDSEFPHTRPATTADLISDDDRSVVADDRSVAADSWSIKSDYGSTLDDDQRHVDASDVLSSGCFQAASDYSSDKEAPDAEIEPSVLGLQSYWDSTYADELANFHEHGHSGEIWFGPEVMDTVATWTKNLCINISQGRMQDIPEEVGSDEPVDQCVGDLSSWSLLDIGTGNGLLLQEFAKQGFSDMTGVDYSEGAIDLARSLAERDGFLNINFLVDDILETKLDRQFRLVMDKGTLDAIGLHPDGPMKRVMYWESVLKLVTSGGVLVITSCNHTKDELVRKVENMNQRRISASQDTDTLPVFRYISHVRSYSTFMFGGSEGSRVATVAFLRS